MVRRSQPIVLPALLVLAAASPGFAASLDDRSARKAIAGSPDRVLAAVVEVQSVCHAEDAVCVDGVKVVEVLLSRDPSGASVAVGDFVSLTLGAGKDAGLPAVGDQVLFVGQPDVQKDGTRGFVTNTFTVAPGPKAVDELRTVVREPIKRSGY